MTADSKWLIVGIGFAICFYIGWFLPALWLLWIVAVFAVLLTPTKKKVSTVVATAIAPTQAAYAESSSLGDLEDELRAKLLTARNDDVREGLEQALALVVARRSSHTVATTAPVQTLSAVAAPVSTPPKPLDQTLVLLYIGAFLLLGGMSLFVAYGDLSDQLRIVIIALMAIVFYGGGLYLYRTKQSLRPAGVTFVSIGLLMIPLVGFAVAYLLDGTSPQAVWLLTSLIALPLYVFALYVTRAQVVGYMAFLMWLSLAESAVNLFDAPLYMFAWAAIALGIVTQLLIAKYAVNETEVREPFRWSTLVLVPAAVLANFLFLDEGLAEWQLGVSLLLAGVYYAVCVYTSKAADKEKDGYLIASHGAVVLGLLLIAHDNLGNEVSFGAVVVAVGLAHLGLWFGLKAKLGRFKVYENTLYTLAGLLPLLACGWFIAESGWLLAGLLVALVVTICLMLGNLRTLSAGLSVVIGLLIPPAFTNVTPGFSSEHDVAALSTYYFGAFACFVVARILRNVYPVFIQAMQIGYGVALGAAWILALASGNYAVQIIVSLLTLGSLVALSSYEKKAELYYALPPIAAVLFGIIFHHTAPGTSIIDVIVYSIATASAVSYGLSLLAKEKRGEALLVMGIAGGLLAWLLASVTTSDHHTILFRYFAPTILAITSLTVLGERKRLKGGSLFALAPGAGLLLALCQAIYLTDSSTNLLVYTHLWALYGVAAIYLVSRRSSSKDSIDALTYATLAVFTVPVVFKTLGDSEGLYNLLLLFEQTALLMLGVALRKKLLTYWGAAVIVLSVVYLLRSFAYLQLVLIAVVLIGYALYRLTRAK